MRRLERLGIGGECGVGPIALDVGLRGGRALLGQRRLRRVTTRFEGAHLRGDGGGTGVELLNLLAVEQNLLLLTVDRQLSGVGALTGPGRGGFGLDQFNAKTSERRFDLPDLRASDRLPFACFREPGARRLDGLGQLAVFPRKKDFLEAPQLIAQLLIAPCFCRLPLERAALLLDLEHDVVDAREVQLRGFQLELSGPAPRFVLRDAGRFFDQLAAIGWARAEDHPDLALLDDRVGLRAESRVHEQVVDVPQAARNRAVDQVLTLSPERYKRVAVTFIESPRATD